MSAFRFYLGIHHADWLEELSVPMFVSHHTLAYRRTLPRAAAPWACNSGGFTQLDTHGAFQTTPEAYAAAVRRYRDEIGRLQWAAPQDWMTFLYPSRSCNVASAPACDDRFTGWKSFGHKIRLRPRSEGCRADSGPTPVRQ